MSLTFTWLINQTFDGTLLRDFLRDEIHLSKRALIELKFNGGNITINDNEVNVRHKLSNGEKLTITFPNEKRSESLIPKKINLKILYEDDHLLVVNKSPNFATTPSREHPSHSLANGLAYYYNEQGNSNAVHIVTRLDRDTSGLVLVAKHRFAHHLFSIQQKNRAISRSYIAIVHGELKDSYGKIDKPMGNKR
jgi:23S rRNA pseudouridine1911/1915/1917 synthase